MNSGIHNTRLVSIHSGQRNYEFEFPLVKNIIMQTIQMHYYFSLTYTFFDLDFIDFFNIMLVLCVYFRYLSVKSLRTSKWWNSTKRERKDKKV